MVALGNLIKWQKLDYDFGQYTCDYITDVRTLIISDGPTILPVSVKTEFNFQFLPNNSFFRPISLCHYGFKPHRQRT